jgi:hypothetical protein
VFEEVGQAALVLGLHQRSGVVRSHGEVWPGGVALCIRM